jgi:hypothetical protein
MRSTIVATALVLFIVTSAVAQSVLPRAIDLDMPGAMERPAQRNPTHYVVIQRIQAEAGARRDTQVPGWLRASFNAQGASYQPIVLTSHPPKRRLSFTLDDTRYVTLITLTNAPGTVVP